MARQKRSLLIGLVMASCLMLLMVLEYGYAFNETHLDSSKITGGCGACHKNHGKKGTWLLDQSRDETCFKCHGPAGRTGQGRGRSDILSVIQKRYSHPIIQTSQYHVAGEELPEMNPAAPRHASCYDCHNAHKTTKEKPLKGARGNSGKKRKLNEAQKEYEVCYLCHSTSANRPSGSKNIAEEFDIINPSFHPVESRGKNRNVPSLTGTLSPESMIKCSDCHGNDDRFGPKGPHGSNYEYMLKANFSTQNGIESSNAYALCYECHNRNSILRDDSFKSHKRHIVYANISCHSCHASHGSRTYENLIRFDPAVAAPNSAGQLAYMKLGYGKPRCFLSCHVNGRNFDHRLDNNMSFCVDIKVSNNLVVSSNCLTGW